MANERRQKHMAAKGKAEADRAVRSWSGSKRCCSLQRFAVLLMGRMMPVAQDALRLLQLQREKHTPTPNTQ